MINTGASFAKPGLSNITQCDSLFQLCQNGACSCYCIFLSCIHGTSFLRHPLLLTYWLDSIDNATHSRPERLSVESDSCSQASICSRYLLPSHPPTNTCKIYNNIVHAHCTTLRGPLTVRGASTLHFCVRASAGRGLDVCSVKTRR